MRIGLLLGMLNEKNNQVLRSMKKDNNSEEETIIGDGKMLMNM